MAVTARQDGRNLVLTVEGVDEPFVIRPLPGIRGQELTEYFLRIATQQPLVASDGTPIDMATVLNWAVNGVDEDLNWISDGPNSNRVLGELTLEEGQDVLMPAFYWTSVLGIDGVTEYFAAGGGMAGSGKAMRSLALVLGISPLATSPSLESATRTPRQDSSTSTSIPTGGSALEKLPPEKRSRWQNGRRKKSRQ